MIIRPVVLVFLMLLTALASVVFAADRHEGSYLHEVTNRWVTPHLKWAKPLAGGPIKTLFIATRRIAGREIAEIQDELAVEQMQ